LHPETVSPVTDERMSPNSLLKAGAAKLYWNYEVLGLLQQIGAIPAPGQQLAVAGA
jgi:hypothetical protein